EDYRFLLEQRLASRVHKNISYDPHTGKAGGFLHHSPNQAEQLRQLLKAFSQRATAWLAAALPDYARSWNLDRVSYRPLEEATRKLRLTARNDLLHVDAFPSRPTNGYRILRLFANVNPTEPRVWVTSDRLRSCSSNTATKRVYPAGKDPTWSSAWAKGLSGCSDLAFVSGRL